MRWLRLASIASACLLAVAMFDGQGARAGASLPGGSARNLVVNPGFETPVVDSDTLLRAPYDVGGWQLVQHSIDLVPTSYWDPAKGNQSIDMSGLDRGMRCDRKSEGHIYQEIPTTPGSTYLISFSLAGNPDFGSVKRLQVVFGADHHLFTFDSTGHSHDDMGWVRRHFRAVATDAITRLWFVSRTPTCQGATLDQVVVRLLSS